jgi:hypothetical protein
LQSNFLTEKSFRQKAVFIYQEYATRYKRRFKWLSPNFLDIKKLKRDLLADSKALIHILQDYGKWNSNQDKKLDALIKLLTKTHPQDKVLIFTLFADSVRYLIDNLQAEMLNVNKSQIKVAQNMVIFGLENIIYLLVYDCTYVPQYCQKNSRTIT